MKENEKLVLIDSIIPMQLWLITDKAQKDRNSLISMTYQSLTDYHKWLSQLMYGYL